METAVATRGTSTAIEPAADYVPIAGIDQLGPDDFSIGVLKIIQSKTQINNMDAQPEDVGKWLRTDTGEIIEQPDLVMIGIAKQRVLFKSEFDGDKTPLCRSDDGVRPRAQYIGLFLYVEPAVKGRKKALVAPGGDQGGNFEIMDICANCPLSQWLEGYKPPCRLSDSWAAVTPERDPVLVRFGGSAAKIGTTLKTLGRIAHSKRKPLHISLGTHKETNEISSYYVPDILPAKTTLDPELVEMAREFASINLAARYEDLADEDAPPEIAQPARHTIDLSPDMTNMPEEFDPMPF